MSSIVALRPVACSIMLCHAGLTRFGVWIITEGMMQARAGAGDAVGAAAPAALPPGPWVVYAGNPDRYQDLDVLFAAMHLLPEARLLLVSAADMGEWEAQLPPGTLRVQTSDFAVVRAHLAAADIGAIPRVQCSGFPIKLLNQLGMGLPTVMSASAAVDLPGVVVALALVTFSIRWAYGIYQTTALVVAASSRPRISSSSNAKCRARSAAAYAARVSDPYMPNVQGVGRGRTLWRNCAPLRAAHRHAPPLRGRRAASRLIVGGRAATRLATQARASVPVAV
jgi:hypothetical protein